MFSFLSKYRRPEAHFLHIGKTGGSAIKSVLADNSGNGAYRIHLHKHEVTMGDIPAGQKMFFCLRDPVSRFVSGFHSRQRKGQPRYYVEWTPAEREAYETFATPNDLALALGRTSGDPDSPAVRAMSAVKHLGHYNFWYGDIDTFKSRVSDILYIGFQDSLDTDFENLRRILGLGQEIQLPKDDIGAHRNDPGLDRSLDPEAREALESWYAEDYAFFDYCRMLHRKGFQG